MRGELRHFVPIVPDESIGPIMSAATIFPRLAVTPGRGAVSHDHGQHLPIPTDTAASAA